MSTTMQSAQAARMNRSDERSDTLDGTAAAFGLSAAVTIVFNTILAWIKDAYDPLNSFMASLTGHHWITHGLVDVALFLILGLIFARQAPALNGAKAALLMAGAIVVSGGGLALWFVLV